MKRRDGLSRGIAKRLGVMTSQMVTIAEWESRRGRRKGRPRTENEIIGREIRRERSCTRRGRVKSVGRGAGELEMVGDGSLLVGSGGE